MMTSNRREGSVLVDFRNCNPNYLRGQMRDRPVLLEYVEYPPNTRNMYFLSVLPNGQVYNKVKSFDFPYLQFWKTDSNMLVTASKNPLNTSVIPNQANDSFFDLEFISFPNSSHCYICLGGAGYHTKFEERVKYFWNLRFDYEINSLICIGLLLDGFAYAYAATDPGIY